MNSECEDDVQSILSDAIQFVEKNHEKFAESTSHIYRLLLELPHDSSLRRTYEETAVERLKVAADSSDAARTPQSRWLKVKKAVVSRSRAVTRFADGKE